jgi:hypothetical protein
MRMKSSSCDASPLPFTVVPQALSSTDCLDECTFFPSSLHLQEGTAHLINTGEIGSKRPKDMWGQYQAGQKGMQKCCHRAINLADCQPGRSS